MPAGFQVNCLKGLIDVGTELVRANTMCSFTVCSNIALMPFADFRCTLVERSSQQRKHQCHTREHH